MSLKLSKLLKFPKNFSKCLSTCNKKSKVANTAIVTGASNGIGLEFVEALIQNGVSNIVMSDILEKEGEEEQKKFQCKYTQTQIIFVKCNVAKCDEIKELFKKAVDCFGYVDLVINNAGIYDEINWDKMIDVNLKSVVCGSILGTNYMSKCNGGKGGTIVNTSSILGMDSMAAAPVYTLTKHAVNGYTRCWGHPVHFERSGVRVMALCPGLTETKMVLKARRESQQDATPLTKEWARETSLWKSQHSCHTGLCLIRMLKEGTSGSIWMVENGEIDLVSIPTRTDIRI